MDGPFIEGQDLPKEFNKLKGNELTPVVINCQVTCLNHSVTNLVHNPGLGLIVTKLGKPKNIEASNRGNDTENGLFVGINYTSNNCEQANNYTMQYTFAIYPTIKMDRTVARCGVSYYHNRSYCWGEAVIFIQYIQYESTVDYPTPTITKYMTTTQGPAIATMPVMMPGTGGSGGNLVTIFVVILALALAAVTTIAIIEGLIIAVIRRRRHPNRNGIGQQVLNGSPDNVESVQSATPPNELSPPHDEPHQ